MPLDVVRLTCWAGKRQEEGAEEEEEELEETPTVRYAASFAGWGGWLGFRGLQVYGLGVRRVDRSWVSGFLVGGVLGFRFENVWLYGFEG